MKYLIFILMFISLPTWAQLVNSVELTEKLTVTTEDAAKKELLHRATLKSFEKFIPELGYKLDEFNEKLNTQFKEYFNNFKEKKIIQKFGANYKKTLSETERVSYLASLEAERQASFIRYSHTAGVLRSHSLGLLTQSEKDPFFWKAKVEVDIDRLKLDKLLRKVLKGETKPFAKLILISEIDIKNFSWPDLGLANEKAFLSSLNDSWLKWLNENLPSTVEDVVICDVNCMSYYKKWSETHLNEISVPEEFSNSVFLKINFHLKRSGTLENLQELTFEWEGWTLLHDIATKRVLESFVLPMEKRTFRHMSQKALNSGLASALYRSPMTALMQFNRKLEEKIGFNRVSKIVVKGYRHLGDVVALTDLLKTRGSSLGLDIILDNFSKDEAHLLCFYRGEEKSFTDILLALKKVKSTQGYTLVNEFTGVHHVIKFVTE